MKNICRLLPLLAIGLILSLSSVVMGQKRKSTTRKTPPKKTVEKPTVPSTSELTDAPKILEKPSTSSTSESMEKKWQTLKVEECGFSVEIPSKPQKIVNENGVFWAVNFPDSYYQVSCLPMGKESVLRPDGFLAGQILGFPGEIKSKTIVNVTDSPGTLAAILFGITNDGLLTGQSIYAVTKKEVCINLIAQSTKENGPQNNESVKRFLGSLKLF